MKHAPAFTAIIIGLLLAWSGSPWNWWWLAVVALALLFRCTQERAWRSRLLTGWVSAFVLFLISLSWTRQFSLPGYVVLAAVEALFMAVAIALVPHRGLRRAPIFVSALFCAEALRIRLPFGGLPMGGLTTGQPSGPLSHAAAIVGEPGIVAVLALCAVALSEVLRLSRKQSLIGWLSMALAVVVAVWGSRIELPVDRSLSIATVQAGGQQALLRHEQDPLGVFNEHYAETDRVASSTELIVWPENTVVTEGTFDGSDYEVALKELAIAHDATLMVGLVERYGNQFRNAVVVIDPDGVLTGRYEKHHRVPFGEYVPGRALFDRIADLSQVPYDAIAGTTPSAVRIGEGNRIGVAVSFEGLFADRGRAAARDGGQLLVIPTNAASYESSNVAKAQVQAARFRALEAGQWVAQASPTGISAVIDNDGKIRAESTIGPAAVLQANADLVRGRTPYVRWGDAPLLIISTAVLLIGFGVPLTARVRAKLARRRAPDAHPSAAP